MTCQDDIGENNAMLKKKLSQLSQILIRKEDKEKNSYCRHTKNQIIILVLSKKYQQYKFNGFKKGY